MIRVKNLFKSFQGQAVLDGINLEVRDGEILVLLGASGAGKSVLLKHLIGLLPPDQGNVEIDGRNISCLSEDELLSVRKDIGFLFQEGALYDFMDVFDNLAFPLREHTSLNERTVGEKVRAFLRMVDLKETEEKYPSELSGGMKKRVGLARALILDSRILFCDEPTSGLDPIRSREISDLIRNISRELRCTTVITSHDIKNSLRVADRLALLKNGRIHIVGTREDFLGSEDSFVKDFLN